MSKTIDERVVEMRFNNKDFESNVQTSLKTIDKLKESLNFDESTKSVEKFQDSLKHFSLDDIGNSLESLSEKFNWGNVFKLELLSNVVDTIYSTITGVFNRIKGELHLEDVDPVSNMLLGWQKYADKTQSVATIMAATGESMEVVNEQMERLLYFTDETSYSFTDMTNNIGKFTANGIDLGDASTAMQGIATWAARSGQNAQTASRVMYNLAQAIGMGALKLQDWKSVELANMGTKEFKEMAISVGLANGALTRNAEGIAVIADGTENTLKETTVTVENFRETLKEGWLDNQTLMETLQEYGKAAELINDLHESTGMYAADIIELARSTRESKTSLKDFAAALGYTEEEFEDNKDLILELKDAFELLASDEYAFSLATYEAAQEARTFGDAMASVADAVSSGWMKTFELLFGGYDRAKVLWTDLATNLIEIFGRANDSRNKLLKEANVSGWDKFSAEMEAADISMLDLEASLRRTIGTRALRLMKGDAESFEEALKQGKISSDALYQAIDNLPSTFKRIREVTGEVVDNYEEMTEWSWELRKGMYGFVGHDDQVQKLMEAKDITKEYAEQVVALSERHHELGRELTKEEAAEWLTYTAATERLEETVELTDEEREALKALTEELDKKGAQESFVNGLMNIGHIALETFNQIHDAIEGMFPPMTADKLRNLANGFEKVTGKLLNFITETNAIKNIVTALIFPFRVLADIVSMLFKLVSPLGQVILAAFMPIFGVVDAFGAWLISIRETTGRLNPFKDVIDKVGEALQVLLGFIGEVATKVGGFVKDKLIEKLSGPFEKLVGVLNKFKEGKLKGLDDFIKSIKSADVDEAASKIIDKLRNIYTTAQQILVPIADVFKAIREHFEYLERNKRFSGLSTLQNVFETIRWVGINAIRQIEIKLQELGVDTDKLEKHFEPVANFFTKLKDAIMAFAEPIANVFQKIKDHFDYLERAKQFTGFTTLQNVIETVRWVAVSAFKSIRDGLKEVGIDLDPLIEKFTNAYNAVKTFFSDLKNNGDGETIFTRIKNQITEGASSLGEFLKGLGVTLPKVLTGGGIALAGAGIVKFIKTLKDAKQDNGKGIIENLISSLNPFSDTIEKLKTATSSFNLTNFAISIGLLAGALIALSFVPTERLVMSLGALGTSLAGFIGTIAAVDKIMGDKGTFRLVGMGLGMIMIAGSLLLFASALNKIKKLDIGSNSDVLKIFGGLFLAVSSMKRLAKAAGKFKFKLSNGLALVAAAGALWMFGKTLESYSNLSLDEQSIEKALSILVLAIVSMSALAIVTGKNNFKFSNGAGLIAMALSLLILGTAVKNLGKLDIGILAKGIIAVGLLTTFVTVSLWFLADASRAIGGKAGLGQFAMLIGLAVAIVAFGSVAALLGFIPVDKLTNGITAVGLLSAIVAALAYFVGKIGEQTTWKGATKGVLLLVGTVAAITILGVVLAGLGLLAIPVALGCAVLIAIITDLAIVFSMIKSVIAPNIKDALLGILAIALFGLALIPMINALKSLGKLNYKKTQQNMILLAELFDDFLALIGVATLVGLFATAAGPILLVGMGVVAGIFALFVGAITILVKDLERLAALDIDAAQEGLECVKEELNILTDLAREFQENEGLFTASLGAALVCSAFGSGLHKLSDDTFILGLANAERARDSLGVVKEEISLMITLGEYLSQNEGSFGKAITASATAFSFGVGLHGLANDTRILGLTNAENAKSAIEPMNDLIGMMLTLANTIGTDSGLFAKALVTSADMIAFALGLLPLVGAEFLAGLADAKNVTANMGQITSMIGMLMDIATKMGDDSKLYFGAKATAVAIGEFADALIPLVAAEFVGQFVDAEASIAGFEATKSIVDWLINIATYFQGENSITEGAVDAVDTMKNFAKALGRLTAVDFFSQFVSNERAVEGLGPVQTVIDMLVGLVQEFAGTQGMTAAAEVAVEAVKSFAENLSELMFSMSTGVWQSVDPSNVTAVVDAIVDGIVKISSINGDISGVGEALSGIGDIFESIGNLGTKGGLFGGKTIDTSGITESFAVIKNGLIDLANAATEEQVGVKIMDGVITPISEQATTATGALYNLCQAMSDTVASFETSFNVDGNNIAVGFINGITARNQDAYDAGFALAESAERGTRDAGDINSPSKVFDELGGYVGEGFVDGIESKYGQISDAGKAMVERVTSIVETLKDRMQALLADKANELQIRPVIDDSEITSLGSLLSSIQGARSFGSYQVNSEVVDQGIRSKSVMPELKSLHEHLAQLGEHMDGLQVVLDTGTLVGATSAKMDSQFGIMSMRRGRGN